MVTGQAIVLWSRLHLVVHGEKGDRILQWTKWMIIVNAICLHIPTTVLTWGSNANIQAFIDGYNVMEKLQMCGFFIQEIVLSSIYIVETVKILRTSLQNNTRRLMYQLIAINVLIIIMDLGLLGLEAASLYILETIFKGFLYSLKLKLEFAILSKLVKFVGRGDSGGAQRRGLGSIAYIGENDLGPPTTEKSSGLSTSHQNNEHDVSDFVDLSRTRTDYTHATPVSARRNSPRHGVTDFDMDMARLEHVETVSSVHSRRPNGDVNEQV